MGWLDEVGSVSTEVTSIVVVGVNIVEVTVKVLLVSVVVSGDNWLVVVDSGGIVPVDMASVPGLMS